eukprot:1854385-Prymnesium_polylepis.2
MSNKSSPARRHAASFALDTRLSVHVGAAVARAHGTRGREPAALLDRHFGRRPVVLVDGHGEHRPHDLHPEQHAPKDDVLAVEVGQRRRGDEELRAVAVAPTAGHRQQPRRVVR